MGFTVGMVEVQQPPSEESMCSICLEEQLPEALFVQSHQREDHDAICRQCMREHITHISSSAMDTGSWICPARNCGAALSVEELHQLGIVAVDMTAVHYEAQESDMLQDAVFAEKEFQSMIERGVVQKCGRCGAPTEHKGGCPRMFCPICAHQWTWGHGGSWGIDAADAITAEQVSPEEAQRRWTLFMRAETMDAQVAAILLCLAGVVGILWVASHVAISWQSCLTVFGIANNLVAKARDAGRAVARYNETYDIANASERHLALLLGILTFMCLVGLAWLSMWGRLRSLMKPRDSALPITAQHKAIDLEDDAGGTPTRARASSDEFSVALVIS